MESIHSWLHLSDLHFGGGDQHNKNDARLVLGRIIREVKKVVESIRTNDRGRPYPLLNLPDALVLTGDITFSGTTDQFDQAAAWLADLRGELGDQCKHVLVVPGNHDATRVKLDSNPHTTRLLNALRGNNSELDNSLERAEERKALVERFASFTSFVGKIKGEKGEPLGWQTMVKGRGMDVRYVGLNTALLANDDKDFKELVLGNSAFAKILCEEHTGPTVVLTHHPLEWLHDGEFASQWIKSNAQVHLCGHIHRLETHSSRAGYKPSGCEFVRVVSGAGHNDGNLEGTEAHGFNFGELVRRDDGQVALRVVPFFFSSKSMEFRIDRNSTPENQDYVEHQLNPLPPSSVARQPPTASKNASSQDTDKLAVKLPGVEIASPAEEYQTSFDPMRKSLKCLDITTTQGWVRTEENRNGVKLVRDTPVSPEANKVILIKDPLRPFEIQIGKLRALRPGGDPGTVPLVDGLSMESVQHLYPIIIMDPNYLWLRMIFAELATNPEVLSYIFRIEPNKEIRRIVARNPSSPEEVKQAECLFCDPTFLPQRIVHSKKVSDHGDGAVIIHNDFAFGPHFHYIVFPRAPIHSWERVTLDALSSMNFCLHEFLNSRTAEIEKSHGIRIGLNSSVRHLVLGSRTKSSAGASIPHVHKQAWGMGPNPVNLGDHLYEASQAAAQNGVDYQERYLEALREARLVIAENDHMAIYVPFGQIAIHEIQVMLKQKAGDFRQLSEQSLTALSEAELVVNRIYSALGISSFNELFLLDQFRRDGHGNFRIVACFVTREVDLAISELNLAYVVDKTPAMSKGEIEKVLPKVAEGLRAEGVSVTFATPISAS